MFADSALEEHMDAILVDGKSNDEGNSSVNVFNARSDEKGKSSI